MRGVLGFVALVGALALVAVLAKQQIGKTGKALAPETGIGSADASPNGSVRTQAQQLPQQVRQAMEAAMARPRPAAELDSSNDK